ncbi:MAG: Asp23/Gls24 family envelope stress response protein [Pseudonocardiaceae bacterium]
MSMDPASTTASETGPEIEYVIGRDVVACIAVRAASRTSGVVRVEAGLRGLVGSWRRAARHYTRAADPPPTDGVSVEITGDSARIHVNLVCSGQDQAAAIGQAVQRSVSRAVRTATGLAVDEVSVSIVDIDIRGGRG